MKKEEVANREELFLKILEEFQEFRVEELIKTHRDFLPRFVIINAFSRVQKLINYALRGVKYFIVLSSEGEIEGLIKDVDLVYLLVAGAARFSTFSGVSRIGVLGKEVPTSVAVKFVAEEVMRWGPTVTTLDDKVKHLLKLMWDSRSHTVIIIDEKRKPVTVIDEAAILSMVEREVSKRFKLDAGIHF